MSKKILLLGHTGKMGLALRKVFENGYVLICKNSDDFDALDFSQVRNLINTHNADIVISTVAFLGIDPCEKEPIKAFKLNALYPKLLAEISNERNLLLIHFSTDAVFNDEKRDYYTEKDTPKPLNVYGVTKYAGDCFIKAIAKNYYIFRLSVLFGEALKETQFLEKMLQKVREGAKTLKISDDVILSPTYSRDVALEVRRILENLLPFGLYHIANEGMASLYDLMSETVRNLDINVEVKKASYKDFPFVGRKNTYTPIKSEKIASLRFWKEAVREYCNELKKGLYR